jgi:hypothetical protein
MVATSMTVWAESNRVRDAISAAVNEMFYVMDFEKGFAFGI